MGASSRVRRLAWLSAYENEGENRCIGYLFLLSIRVVVRVTAMAADLYIEYLSHLGFP